MPSMPAAPLFLTTCSYAALRLSLLSICSMRLLVSMRCFLSAPFALAAFGSLSTPTDVAPVTKWNVLQLIDCLPLCSIPIAGTSSLLWALLTSHSSLLLRLMRPPVRSPRLRCALFPLIYLPPLLVLPATFWTSSLIADLSVFPSLICGSCSSGQGFAYSFLQISPRDEHPCCSAMYFAVAYAYSGLSPVRARPWRANYEKALEITLPGSSILFVRSRTGICGIII